MVHDKEGRDLDNLIRSIDFPTNSDTYKDNEVDREWVVKVCDLIQPLLRDLRMSDSFSGVLKGMTEKALCDTGDPSVQINVHARKDCTEEVLRELLRQGV